jgi:hypothetical protein
MERARRCHAQGLFKPTDVLRQWPPVEHIVRSVAGYATMNLRTQ